jgi:hypothetical protein
VPGTPPPAAATPRAGKLTARVTPAADRRAPFRFKTSGKLTLPPGVASATGCKGPVTVTTRSGSTVILTRIVQLTSKCTYSSTASFASRTKLGKSARLKFSARFGGNALVSPASAPARYGRVR